MNFTFWVTEDCNLKCKYCYVNKAPKTMEQKTATKAIEFIEKVLTANPEKQNDKIHIGLHGGEPLLNFPIIRFFIEELKLKFSNNIDFSMTTNGTIHSKEILDYVVNHVQLTVSVDGEQGSHDLNRVYKNGQGSYRRVMETIEYLNNQAQFYRVRMTVTANNVMHFAENYIYLSEKGCPLVTFAIDESNPHWNKELMRIYHHNLNDIFTYMVEKDLRHAQYHLYNFKNEYFRPRGACDACLTSFHFSSTGEIYPCIYAVGHSEFSMGNVFDGLNLQQLSNLHKVNQHEEGTCTRCAMYNNCRSKMCKIINKIQTENYYKASPVFCTAQKIHYSTVKSFEHILENFAVGK
ncbi:radical SAM protein [Paenibacillus polymyxa]|uniref:radical SAM/SPASM domain-containing protein n=1 Tax=Paenibacillus polymyxa TaxID=1406 RepID=UPI0004D93513|nr:radical SAM protein [Paenibacillus polymyxa]KEO77117.1 radical SAM protein [Paenibacillus polymyxa]MCH6189036.1 radical SAM protein [Paenibacillus polymyxa]MDY8095770.1 radical SAM protein [Paenibacillus polymyxa]WRL57861.1 radical SAM protein [Paenibacillus polymyxa]